MAVTNLIPIKRIYTVDADALHCVNHYKIVDVCDRVFEDGHADVVYVTIDEFDMTWKEIDEYEFEGGFKGFGAVTRDIEQSFGAVAG